jgi:hypothetical protein
MSQKYAVNNVFKWKHFEKLKSIYRTHPQLSNACTGFITFSAGDLIAQKLDKNSTHVNMRRAVQLGLLGVVMNGFFLHRWFIILDNVIGKSVKNGAILKVMADQVVYAPFTILTFFGFACVMKPSTEFEMKTLTDKIQNDFVKTYIADCTIWPAANFINFTFVPLIYRASFTAITQLVWQTYLSVVTHMNKNSAQHVSTRSVHDDSQTDGSEDEFVERDQSGGHITMLVEAVDARMNGAVHA